MRHLLLIAAAFTAAAILYPAAPSQAHIAPATVIELDVREGDIIASLTLPQSDLATASGIAEDNFDEAVVADYLGDHFAVSADGAPWSVLIDAVSIVETEQWGTGAFRAVAATVVLTPPDPADLRGFTLQYDAIVHEVVTADILVLLRSDWAAGEVESARELGVIATDTRSGTVEPLEVSLDAGSPWHGFTGMLALGMSHIAEGTDHQLFLLTLLLPAPLLAAGGRWRGVAPIGKAVGRITAVTIAFTIGHSVTLALGVLGLPVPARPVEALIAGSILVAAVHAIRPFFPGREPIVAGCFGLVHGMAFSMTLTALGLDGTRLALSVLGFNLGIELMQLIVVAVVLPPLLVLARTRCYTPLRIAFAALAAAAATGWLLDRLGAPGVLAAAADTLGPASPWIAAALWVAAAVVLVIKGLQQKQRHLASADA